MAASLVAMLLQQQTASELRRHERPRELSYGVLLLVSGFFHRAIRLNTYVCLNLCRNCVFCHPRTTINNSVDLFKVVCFICSLARTMDNDSHTEPSIQESLLDFFLALRLQAADFLAIKDHVQEVCRALAARLFAAEQTRQPLHSDQVPAKVRSHAQCAMVASYCARCRNKYASDYMLDQLAYSLRSFRLVSY
jgi:hypothetical protein